LRWCSFDRARCIHIGIHAHADPHALCLGEAAHGKKACEQGADEDGFVLLLLHG
jgi:hypothetical protein